MCKYSLEAYATRKAVQGEVLVANQHSAQHHGVFTKLGTRYDGALTCVRDGQKLTIEKLELAPQIDCDILRRHDCGDAITYIGKRVVVELIDGRGVPTGMDSLRFGGMYWGVPLAWLKPGTEVYVGVKKEQTLDEKLQLDKKSLRRVAADMALIDPNPKPEDEEEKEKEKEDEPAPSREAARLERRTPTPSLTTRVRRRIPVLRNDDF